MADVPSGVNYGRVTGRFVQFISDTTDPGNVPDEVPLTGSVSLVPQVSNIRFPTTVPPRLAVAQVVTCRVVAGDLLPPGTDSTPGVWVIATDQPMGQPNKVQWQASFNLTNVTVQPAPVVFEVPANDTVDLSVVTPATLEAPIVTVVSHADALAAQQSAADAAASAAVLAQGTAFLVLATGAPVPPGTPGGTVILRTP